MFLAMVRYFSYNSGNGNILPKSIFQKFSMYHGFGDCWLGLQGLLLVHKFFFLLSTLQSNVNLGISKFLDFKHLYAVFGTLFCLHMDATLFFMQWVSLDYFSKDIDCLVILLGCTTAGIIVIGWFVPLASNSEMVFLIELHPDSWAGQCVSNQNFLSTLIVSNGSSTYWCCDKHNCKTTQLYYNIVKSVITLSARWLKEMNITKLVYLHSCLFRNLSVICQPWRRDEGSQTYLVVWSKLIVPYLCLGSGTAAGLPGTRTPWGLPARVHFANAYPWRLIMVTMYYPRGKRVRCRGYDCFSTHSEGSQRMMAEWSW